MSSPPAAKDIIHLYRSILRYGRNLQYTDKAYFKERVRSEFQKYKTLSNPEQQVFQYKRGLALLENRRIL